MLRTSDPRRMLPAREAGVLRRPEETSDKMKHTMQLAHKKSCRRWYRVALATLLVCFSLITAFSLLVMRTHGAEAALSLPFSAQNANQRLRLDPNGLEDPANYDTRPCVQ